MSSIAGRDPSRIRRDGKPARRSTGHGPTVHNGSERRRLGERFETAPSWHELVLPGPAGDAKKKSKREAAVRRGAMLLENPLVLNRAERRKQGRHNAGRLVLHRTRAKLVDGGARPSVLRRRAERAARAAS